MLPKEFLRVEKRHKKIHSDESHALRGKKSRAGWVGEGKGKEMREMSKLVKKITSWKLLLSLEKWLRKSLPTVVVIFSLINTTAGRKKTFRYANKYKFRVFQFSKIFIFPVRKMETVRWWRVSQENGEVEGVYIEVEWSGMGGGGRNREWNSKVL